MSLEPEKQTVRSKKLLPFSYSIGVMMNFLTGAPRIKVDIRVRDNYIPDERFVLRSLFAPIQLRDLGAEGTTP